MNLLLLLGTALIGFAATPYLVYLYGITLGKKMHSTIPLFTYPPISIVISAYNEEPNIKSRIENLVECGYPNAEIVFVDDHSTDKTFELAKEYLDLYFTGYLLIHNEKQLGTSVSYNRAIKKTKNEIVVVTDADVRFKPDALYHIIERLMSSTRIGAVSGDLQPEPSSDRPVSLEQQYRSFYGRMCEWESANGSTVNFNGALIAFRKSAVIKITDSTGADDANIAFDAIRNGYRAVYEKTAIVYEKVPGSFSVQKRQKVRRATGLILSVIHNLDLVSATFILRAWMWILSPMTFVIGTIYFLFGAGIFSFILLPIILLVLWKSPFCMAFVINQFYLISGLLNLGNNVQTWESTTSLEAQ